jgi:hypothetical protein
MLKWSRGLPNSRGKDGRFYGLVRKGFVEMGPEYPALYGLSHRLSEEKKVAVKGRVGYVVCQKSC